VDAGDVDDGAASPTAQVRDSGLRAQPRRLQVDSHDRVPVGVRHVQSAEADPDLGVVHQAVDPTEPLVDSSHGVRDSGPVLHVAREMR
jgi:hypothetical protein